MNIQNSPEIKIKKDVVITELQNSTLKQVANPKIFCYRIRDPLDDFVGRKSEKRQIIKNLREKKTTIIAGVHGIGKTTLACEIAWRCKEYEKTTILNNITVHFTPKLHVDHLAWIDAESEDTLKNSISELAERLKIKTVNRSSREIIQQMYNSFNSTSILFIFDNIENEAIFQDILPVEHYRNSKIYIIIVSQITEWSNFPNLPNVRLNILRKTESEQILLTNMQRSCNFKEKSLNDLNKQKEDIRKLVDKLQYLPLAIQQTSAFISEQILNEDANYTIKNYLDTYQEKSDASISEHSSKPYIDVIWTTVSVALTKIHHYKPAIELLSYISFLNSERILTNMFDGTLFDQEKNDQAIRKLAKYSLIHMHGNRQYFSIHKLVQECWRIHLKKENKLQMYVRNVLNFITQNKHENHISTVLQYAEENVILDWYEEKYYHSNWLEEFKNRLRNVNCHLTDTAGWSTIHYASCTSGHLKVAESLIKDKADIKRVSKNLWTPLHAAVTDMHCAAIELLLEKGVDINSKTYDGYTALHLAACGGYWNTVNKLIRKKADVDIKTSTGQTALHFAAVKGHNWTICELLIYGRASRILNNNKGQTALQLAEKWKHKNTVNLLKCADEVDLDETPYELLLGSALGYKRAVGEYINLRRKDGTLYKVIDATSNNKLTALHLAAKGGHGWIIYELIYNGDANMYIKDPDDNIPAKLALKHGQKRTYKLLKLIKKYYKVGKQDELYDEIYKNQHKYIDRYVPKSSYQTYKTLQQFFSLQDVIATLLILILLSSCYFYHYFRSHRGSDNFDLFFWYINKW